MIWLQVKNTKPTKFYETVNGNAEQVDKILIGSVERHDNNSDRYCRYVHIVTPDAHLVLELYADNPNALTLKAVGEDGCYILARQRNK